MEDHILEKTKTFPVTIHSADEKETFDYTFFYILEAPEVIDYQHSIFQKTDIIGMQVKGEVEINSAEEFYQAYSDASPDRIKHKKVVLRQKPDVFRLPWETRPCISERLKSKLEEANVSGIEFQEGKIDFEYV